LKFTQVFHSRLGIVLLGCDLQLNGGKAQLIYLEVLESSFFCFSYNYIHVCLASDSLKTTDAVYTNSPVKSMFLFFFVWNICMGIGYVNNCVICLFKCNMRSTETVKGYI